MGRSSRPKVKLFNNSWNSLNKTLNESPELDAMLDAAAEEILRKTKANIRATGAENAARIEERTEMNEKGPKGRVGIEARFVSVPDAGFEMLHSPLKKALNDQ